jgi:hypothetical protein
MSALGGGRRTPEIPLEKAVVKGVSTEALSTPRPSATAPVGRRPTLSLGDWATSVARAIPELSATPAQVSWAEAFSGASQEQRAPGFKMPPAVEMAWGEAYAPMGSKSAWAVTLEGQAEPGYLLVRNGGFSTPDGLGLQYAVFDSSGKCLSSGNAGQVQGAWKATHAGVEPRWIEERKERELAAKDAQVAQAKAAGEHRVRVLATRPPEASPVKWAGMSVPPTTPNGQPKLVELGGNIEVSQRELNALQSKAGQLGFALQVHAPGLSDRLTELPALERMPAAMRLSYDLNLTVRIPNRGRGEHWVLLPDRTVLGGTDEHDVRLALPMEHLFGAPPGEHLIEIHSRHGLLGGFSVTLTD